MSMCHLACCCLVQKITKQAAGQQPGQQQRLRIQCKQKSQNNNNNNVKNVIQSAQFKVIDVLTHR